MERSHTMRARSAANCAGAWRGDAMRKVAETALEAPLIWHGMLSAMQTVHP